MNYKSLNIFLFFWNILFKVECSYNKFCIVKDYVGKKRKKCCYGLYMCIVRLNVKM